jgi:preprotein translocase subunit YajC
MPSSLLILPALFAQGGDAAPAAGASDGLGGMIQFLPIIALFALAYFMLMRPQMQQEKKRQEMLKVLKKNDRVLTSAGIYGTVVSMEEGGDKVVLKIGEDDRGTKVAFTRASIVKVLSGEKPDKVETPDKS